MYQSCIVFASLKELNSEIPSHKLSIEFEMHSMLIMAPSIVKSVQMVVGTHCAMTVLSIARAGIGGGRTDDTECFDAKHYDLVTDFIGRIYLGRPVMKKEKKNRRISVAGVKFSPTVCFQDPAAICVNEPEVLEAFRALRLLNPISLSSPICVNVKPNGDSIRLTYRLNQQYTLPLYHRTLNVKSLLSVNVKLQQMQDCPESEFVITSMKEFWYGTPLIQPYPLFYIPRRLNGIISYYITSLLL